jgi:hypothetical protein
MTAPPPAWLLLERLDTAALAAALADIALQACLRACTDAGIHGPVLAARIQEQRRQAAQDTGQEPEVPGVTRALRLVTSRHTRPDHTPTTHTGTH